MVCKRCRDSYFILCNFLIINNYIVGMLFAKWLLLLT